jgi:hypothetical protein
MNDGMTTSPTAASTKSPYCVNLKDITGQKFGRLTVLKREGKNISQQATWRCLCECGKETVQAGSTLRAGKVVSCGCYGIEARRAKTQTHGLSHTPIYNYYHSMLSRMAEGHRGSENYHGRGIRICDRWIKSFEHFIEDMLPKLEEARRLIPDKVLTLERRDVNGWYTPDNCYFATMMVQNNNKRNNVRIEHAGQIQTSAQWARSAGMSLEAFRARKNLGWSMEEILSTPVRSYGKKNKTSK